MSEPYSNAADGQRTKPAGRIKLIAVMIYAVLPLVLSGFAAAEDPGGVFEVPVATQRDASFNRVIPTGASITAAARSRSIGAVANTISITQSGSGNTIILDAEQSNSGAVVATGSLNGRLRLD